MNRRRFLQSAGLALAGSMVAPPVFARMAKAARRQGKVLVAIFQRGAADGLNIIVPHGERSYYASRRSIAIPRQSLLDLDGFFGAHPAMKPLLPFWESRTLAVVHAAGSPDSTRSHFDAQDFMESGTPGVKSTRDGFLTRALTATGDDTPLRAVSVTPSLPRILSGSSGVIAASDLSRLGVRGADASASLESMYEEAVGTALGGTASQSFAAARVLDSIRSSSNVSWPRTPLAGALRQIAELIRNDVGLEIAFAEHNGWDTHSAQGGVEGSFAGNLRMLAEAVAAFAADLGSKMNEVVLVTMSEFGRTVRENGSRGTDHGHGTVMLLLGDQVKGGRVHGPWPGLEREQLFEGRDLAVTSDFRDVFGDVLTRHMGVETLATVFPGHAYRPVGVM